MAKLRDRYEKPKTKPADVVAYVVLSVLSVIWLLPLAWLVMSSLRLENGAFTNYVIPKGFTLNNYVRLFTETTQFNYPRWYANSFIVAVFSCGISTMFILMISYAFSRLRFRARTLMMNIALILGMFPGFMSMIAVYHILKAIGLSQSLASLVLVYSGASGLSYYIAKGFFDTIPKALDEAASLDGATKNQIFWKIILPMSKPIITYTVLTSFIAPWVDFIFASVIMKDNYNNYTVAVGLFRMLERENVYQYFTRFCAGAVLIAIPITILFINMQKYYVDGVTGGSVKG
jgi:arabinogalactan oligomer/maltooligosaccharide transport system permease protein